MEIDLVKISNVHLRSLMGDLTSNRTQHEEV